MLFFSFYTNINSWMCIEQHHSILLQKVIFINNIWKKLLWERTRVIDPVCFTQFTTSHNKGKQWIRTEHGMFYQALSLSLLRTSENHGLLTIHTHSGNDSLLKRFLA